MLKEKKKENEEEEQQSKAKQNGKKTPVGSYKRHKAQKISPFFRIFFFLFQALYLD